MVKVTGSCGAPALHYNVGGGTHYGARAGLARSHMPPNFQRARSPQRSSNAIDLNLETLYQRSRFCIVVYEIKRKLGDGDEAQGRLPVYYSLI